MATNEAGPQRVRPPPKPSMRNAGSTEPTVRTARRTSNRPPPKSFIGAPSSAASRLPPVANSQAKVAEPSATSTPQTATAPTSLTSEVRDEIVRRIMPELRVLTENLVKASIDRSLASLLDRQRELEVKVERLGAASFDKPGDFDAKLEAAIAPLLAKQRALELMLDASRHADARPRPLLAEPLAPPALPTQAGAPRPMTVQRPAMGPRSDALAAAALSTNALIDIPAELNGSRRKRIVVFLLLVLVVGVLATVASLSVMSNMGAYP